MANDLMAFGMEAVVAATAAILMVLAGRGAIRALFGARAAYCLWLLVPATILGVAVPRIVPTAPLAAAAAAPVAIPAAVQPVTAATGFVRDAAPIDFAAWFVIVWAIGVAAYALLLLAGHYRFLRALGPLRAEQRAEGRVYHAANPEVGPALVGAILPRIVVPTDFAERFNREEQAVVIAHERVHLLRGDAQVNFLIAVASALMWFHPLVHIAARLIRADQELACDEAVVALHPKARRHYAEAMLKTQLIGTPVPLGCHWFCGGKSELRRRIARLTLVSSRLHKSAGIALAVVLAGGGGVAAWAAQPPVFAPASPIHSASRSTGALMEAIKDGDMAEARILIAAGADVDGTVSGDGSPLIIAARNGDPALVHLLLNHGADPDLAVHGDGNPLIAASAEGHAAIVDTLLAAGAKVDAIVPSDETALINAARCGHLDIVQRLVTAGADVNLAVMAPRYNLPDELRSPLGMARQFGHPEIVRYLIAHGARA